MVAMCGAISRQRRVLKQFVLLLSQHRRRWANIKTTMVQRIVLAGERLTLRPTMSRYRDNEYRLRFVITTHSNSLYWLLFVQYIYKNIVCMIFSHQGWIQGGGGVQWARPPIFVKYFKKSPKLAKLKKKILGASCRNPGRPLSSDPGSATLTS